MSGQDLANRISVARRLDAEIGEGPEAAPAADAAVDQWDSLLATAAQTEVVPAQRVLILDGAGGSRLRRYWLTEQPGDLDAAVDHYREALRESSDHPGVAEIVANNLARALERRYDDRGRDQDLDEAVQGYEEAGQSARLGMALRKRFDHRSTIEDLERAIPLLADAVESLGEHAGGRPALQRELAEALLARYKFRDDVEDLKTAIETARVATTNANAVDADDIAACRSTLANALLTRFERRQVDADLDEAIELFEAVVADPTLAARTTALARANLAGALVARWNTRSREEDLERAVDLYASALETPDLSVRERLGIANNEAAALDDRFHARGALADLDRTVDLYTMVLAATPRAAPERAGRLNNLAIALRTRHVRSSSNRRPDDLERAIRLHREALNAPTATGVEAAALQSNLGNALRTRYDSIGQAVDLRAAVSCFERAVNLTEYTSADRAVYLNNLGAALAQLGVDTDDLDSLERARTASAEAVELTPENRTERARYELNLANVLSDMADRAERRATELYQASARRALVTAPEDALAAAANWSEWAEDQRRWTEVAIAGDIAAGAVSTLLAAQVLRDDKESWLKDAQGISARRTLALGRLDQLQDAALAAETGRALLLSETLQADRRRIEDLSSAGYSELAEKFRRAADAVSAAQHRQAAVGDGNTSV